MKHLGGGLAPTYLFAMETRGLTSSTPSFPFYQRGGMSLLVSPEDLLLTYFSLSFLRFLHKNFISTISHETFSNLEHVSHL